MVLLCFTLDLRSLSPSALRDLKQSLLQLANLYAISYRMEDRNSEIIRDRIGLCYIQRNRISCSDELKIAYCPRGNFRLRDFHQAVNNLPTDAFFPETSKSGAICDVIFSSLLSNEVLYSWGSKDILRKVILISSRLGEKIDSILQNTLIDAAEKCVTVEFVFLERESSHLNDFSENIKELVKSICDLENCSIQTCLPDIGVLCGLVKRWLQELKDDLVEPLQAVFVFKCNIVGSVNQIFGNLFASVNQIIDGFSPCQICKCHGIPLDSAVGKKRKGPSFCPVTFHDLGPYDVIENAVKVGEQTILSLPSFESCVKLQRVSPPVVFNVIERTDLGTLSEGVVIGTSHIVTPSACHEIETISDEYDKLELNTQLFQGLSRALHSLDQGLVCSSNCNIETMRETTFQCFYIVQPSDKGPMLLRRLAGSEEILPIANAIQSSDSSLTKEIESSIQTSLSKIELRDYNPLLHERGFHAKLNLLVKESLHFGSLPLKRKEEIFGANSSKPEPSDLMAVAPLASTKAALELAEDKTACSITEEWEQLIVNEVTNIYSPTSSSSISKSKMEKTVVSPPPDHNKQLDEKTSRILERLETPKQLKTKVSPPVIVNSIHNDTCVVTMKKKPLLPFWPSECSTDQISVSTTQPMKPNFQRLKRKQI